jgi:archaellum component FlaF (FlaF/FlaG flagellin family)
MFHQPHCAMATALLLLIAALLCFALFYKAIEWFEHI